MMTIVIDVCHSFQPLESSDNLFLEASNDDYTQYVNLGCK